MHEELKARRYVVPVAIAKIDAPVIVAPPIRKLSLQGADVSDNSGASVPGVGSPMSVSPGGLSEHENEGCSDAGSLRTVVDSLPWNSEIRGRCILAVERKYTGVNAGDFFSELGDIEVRAAEPVVGPTVAFGEIREADAEFEKALEFGRSQTTGREPGFGQYRPKSVSGIRVVGSLSCRA